MISPNFNRGLIINAQGIKLSDFISYDLKSQHKYDSIEKNTSFHAKLVNSTKNNIGLSADDLDHASTTDIFLMVQCIKVELVIKKEAIKPSDELINKIKEALKHHHKLMDVFNDYGYFLPKRITLGRKIYGMTYLSIDKDLTVHGDVEWTALDDFSESKLEDYLRSYNFDLSYFETTNGELIMKNKIKEWIKDCLECNIDSLQVNGCKELYPLHEIFDLSLRQEVEYILGINMTNESTISN
ncbi:13995_t:CDS:2 [Dentiscutata heterogama]|uniref:13995_t:CDS:1 n=1 Tax=Dentiscutata heterogama TaxID=1316150 RepID=A0ACA9M923_9GLOM|nr:13995_t:CDS:2 [Dentiscutata heterogama]